MARKRGSRRSKLGDQVRRLRDDGLSIRDIQAELGTSQSTIYRLLRSSTIKPVVVEEEEEGATKQRQTGPGGYHPTLDAVVRVDAGKVSGWLSKHGRLRSRRSMQL